MTQTLPDDNDFTADATARSSAAASPGRSLSPALLERVFHQPALVYFNAVSRYLSVREAARRLNTAPSAVTRQIAHLEDVLGLTLFLREGRRLRLAPAGEILYRHTRGLTTALVTALAELDMLRGLKVGAVRIATVESIGLSFVPGLIASFGTRYPRLHLEVAVASSTEVIAQVVDGRAEIGFAFLTRAVPEIEVAFRRDVPIGVLMRPDHPLAGEMQITLPTVVAHRFAVATPYVSIRDAIEPYLHRASMGAMPFVEVDSIRMLVELACTGDYVSIMTPVAAEQELSSGRLIFRRLAETRIPDNRFGIIVKSGASLSYAAAVFFEHAKERLGKVTFPT